jgi:hypothetical protein
MLNLAPRRMALDIMSPLFIFGRGQRPATLYSVFQLKTLSFRQPETIAQSALARLR